jgi:hypothetical protein
MKTIVLLSLFGLMVSCGSKTSGPQSSPASNPVRTISLTAAEEELTERLLEKGTLEQLELIQELGTLEGPLENSLARLDQILEVQCLQTSGLCHITTKENK